MSTKELATEIERLPMASRIRLLEEALRSLRVKELEQNMLNAAQALKADYTNDKVLTAFTAIDLDKFYEAR